jgi:hypothetical protein
MVAIVACIAKPHVLSVCHPIRIQNAKRVPKNADPRIAPIDHRSVMDWAVPIERNRKINSQPKDENTLFVGAPASIILIAFLGLGHFISISRCSNPN